MKKYRFKDDKICFTNVDANQYIITRLLDMNIIEIEKEPDDILPELKPYEDGINWDRNFEIVNNRNAIRDLQKTVRRVCERVKELENER